MKYVEHVQNVHYAPRSLKVEFQASADSVLIDADTARNVELLSSSSSSSGGGGKGRSSAGSLLGVLDRCHTPGGLRQLRAGLFQPPARTDVIQERLDAVAELVAKPGIFHALQSLVCVFCSAGVWILREKCKASLVLKEHFKIVFC